MIELTLYVPGLFGPDAAFSSDYIPDVEQLSLLLSRGRRRTVPALSFHGRVNQLLGYSVPPGRDIPVAAVSRLVDAAEPPEGFWMRADPVHLRADRNGLVLIDASILDISRHDALALASELRGCLESLGVQLEVPAPGRWYLRLGEQVDILTEELDVVIGRDIGVSLPEGGAAMRWNRLLNEMQMLLHQSEVNREREARGLAPINSVWLWGCGELPPPAARCWTHVRTNDVFARGLAMLSGTTVSEVPRSLPALIGDDQPVQVLVILDQCRRAARYRDLEAWHAALRELEAEWFEPCGRFIRQGMVKKFDLLTDRHAWRMTRPGLYRFWRRRKSLVHYLAGVES